MSSHSLDLSGQRAATVTMNDPARTAFQTNAKAGDDVAVQIGGVREIRVQIDPNSVRIEEREFVTRKQRVENGHPVRDEAGNYVFDETPYLGYVLVLPGSASLFGRTSFLEGEEPGSYTATPHTSVSARTWKEKHFSESGTLQVEHRLGELLGGREPGTEG